MPIEKRQFPRAEVACKISVVFADRLLVFNTHTENIGVSGIKVILQEKLNVSTIVDIELFLLGKEIPIKCKGQVVWAKEMVPLEINPRLFETGIEFVQISEPNQEALKKFIDELLYQSRDFLKE